MARRTSEKPLEEVAAHVNYPVALAFGPDKALNVAAPALGTIDPGDYILRIDVAQGPTDVRDVAATAGGRDFSSAPTDYFGGVTPAADETAIAAPAETSATHEAAASGGDTVTMEAGDCYFKPNAVTIAANTPVKFEIKNVAQIPHNFGSDALKISVALPPGETKEVTITAPAGSYEFHCNLPGHKAAGMFGTLTVN